MACRFLTLLTLSLAAAGLAAGCASRTGTAGTTPGGHPVPRPFPVPGGTPHASAPSEPPPAPAPAAPEVAEGAPLTPERRDIVGTALALRGAPYRDGGTDPQAGFDCSGFVQYVFAQHGLAMPREVRDQVRVGRAVKAEAIEPGDLVFFTTVGPGASHVGIAVGGDWFIHAPSARGQVRMERLTSSYWSPRYVSARRLF